MWLAALRQSPKDISMHAATCMHSQPIPDLYLYRTKKDFFPQLPCVCKPTSGNKGKSGRTRQICVPYGEAAQAPCEAARRNPLPEPPSIDHGSCNYRMLPKTTTKKPDPTSPGKSMSERLSTAMYGGAVQAHSAHLADLAALTYNAHMLLDTESNIDLLTTPLLTDTQLPTKHP